MAQTIAATRHVEPVTIPAGVLLRGDLSVPRDAHGIVVFAHGSGSSRLSSRNQRVAAHLYEGKFATLLFDLLTADEERVDERSGQYRFDVSMLGERLVQVTDWLGSRPDVQSL